MQLQPKNQKSCVSSSNDTDTPMFPVYNLRPQPTERRRGVIVVSDDSSERESSDRDASDASSLSSSQPRWKQQTAVSFAEKRSNSVLYPPTVNKTVRSVSSNGVTVSTTLIGQRANTMSATAPQSLLSIPRNTSQPLVPPPSRTTHTAVSGPTTTTRLQPGVNVIDLTQDDD
jgi:hypothetical protein